jgi:phosphate transport system permease protein
MIDNDFVTKRVEADMNEFFPAGQEMQGQINGRRRRGTFFRWLFLFATLAAIVVLIILLLSIINQSFGYVIEQVNVPEEALVTAYNKTRIMDASNVILSSENDQELADGIAGDPYGTGFFGYASYADTQDKLTALSIGGSLPTEEDILSGSYPGTRPLFIYSATEILREKPQVAAFIEFYMQHLDVVADAGYFPAAPEVLVAQRADILAALGVDELPVIDPAQFEGDIRISGSSTVFPVTSAVARLFEEGGFRGTITIDNAGTGAGFDAFCIGKEGIDIVDASRPIQVTESEACRAARLSVTELLIGQDAVVAVKSAANDLAADLGREKLEQLFTSAVTWDEIDDTWPAEDIHRYIPTADSGTMDFFVQSVFEEQTLADIPYDGLVQIYAANVSAGRCRAVERDQRFYADRFVCDDEAKFNASCAGEYPANGCTAGTRSAGDLIDLIKADVIQPRVLKSWYLWPSLTQRQEIALEAATDYPNADLKFKSWLSWDFITSRQSSQPEMAGIRTAILGSLWVVGIALLVGFPLGVGAAVYLQEYADPRKWYNNVIQTNINNLAGVPSIIYGMLGLAVFVRALEPLTSGALFGYVEAGGTANGRTVLSAGLTLALLGLPIIIISAQEAIKAVPPSLREASFGLGATKWQTIWNHVLPNAIPGILTGTILTMSRIIGETAPLVVVGASTFITTDPTSPFSKFTTLPAQVYQWTTRPQDTFRNIAGAAIIVLLILLLSLNATAIFMRNRYSKRNA